MPYVARDNGAMPLDPTFAAAVRALWGDAVDPREVQALAKGMPDSSAVHGPGTRKRKALAAGLVLGTAAEALAAGRTIRPAVRAIRNVEDSASTLHRTARVGEMALQGGNAAVGLTAAATLAPRRKVAKGQPQHMRPRVLVASSARLRRLEGQPLGKGLLSGARDAARLTGHLGSIEHRSYLAGVQTDAMKARFAGRQGRLIPAHAASPPRGRHRGAARVPPAAAVALGGAAAGAGGAAAGAEALKRRPEKVAKAEFRGEVCKVDTEQRNVFGWCSLAIVDGQPVVDLQGDHVPVTEIEKSAYSYVLTSRVGGDMHRRLPLAKAADGGPVHTADLIESVVFTPEKLEKMGLAADALPHGWWVGFHVNDEQQWADVKAGKRLGFSIHGTGIRKDAQL